LGKHFSFWNILLHDFVPRFKANLHEMDALLTNHMKGEGSAYRRNRLRTKITDKFFPPLS